MPTLHELRLPLGVPAMDETHREFVDLIALALDAEDAELASAFERLYEHTLQHFAGETQLMRRGVLANGPEHEAEHARVLSEMGRMRAALAKGRLTLTRTYLAEGLTDWFHNHLRTLDAALAAQLRSSAASF